MTTDPWEKELHAVADDGEHQGDELDGAQVRRCIIVTEQGGRERCYFADTWDIYGDALTSGAHLHIRRHDQTLSIAAYAPGGWLSVRRDGAEIRAAADRALAIALRALANIKAQLTAGQVQDIEALEILHRNVAELAEAAHYDATEELTFR